MRFFRSDQFPLVVAAVPSGKDARRDIAIFYGEWDDILARGRHAVLMDFTKVHALLVGAQERRLIAEEVDRRRDVLSRTVLGEARLCSNPAVRAMLTALDWLVARPLEHPIAHFDERRRAERWLLDRCARSLPPAKRPPPDAATPFE